MTLTLEDGSPVKLGSRLGGGGQGTVYSATSMSGLAVKVYDRSKPSWAASIAKVTYMVANPPAQVGGAGHVSLAWPKALVYEAGQPIGFAMPEIRPAECRKFAELYNPRDRASVAPAFTWEYLLRTARNLAAVLKSLHERGYVVGDLNESNILVNNSALVTLIDCDSMQVTDAEGNVLVCPVGRAEYTPPELQSVTSFAQCIRKPEHDDFALAVLLFLLLMEGVHPFTGVWSGAGDPPTIEQNIKRGACAYAGALDLRPPPYALPFATLPAGVQGLFLLCFGPGLNNPDMRPPAAQWERVLMQAEQQLSHCSRNRQHVFGSHLSSCPWCERVRQGVPDPFPSPSAQSPLPAVNLQRPTRTAPASTRPSPATQPTPSTRPAAAPRPAPSPRPASSMSRLPPAGSTKQREGHPFLFAFGVVVLVAAIIIGVVATRDGGTAAPGTVAAPSTTAAPLKTAVTGPVASGTVLYEADWSQGADGWKTVSEGERGWKTEDGGMLVLDTRGDCVLYAPVDLGNRTDYAVEAEMEDLSGGGVGIFARRSSRGTGYLMAASYWNEAHLYEMKACEPQDLFDDPRVTHIDWDFDFGSEGGGFHYYRFELSGNRLRVFFDGVLRIENTSGAYQHAGRVGLVAPMTELTHNRVRVFSFRVVAL